MRPLILVTNDDGIDSPGLLAAAEAARPFGDLLIAAPRHEQTAMGRSYPRAAEIGSIEERSLRSKSGAEFRAFAVTGSPAQAVSYAVLELCDRMPSLCIAGINFGENLGTTLTGSGTVGAAIEAESYGIPSMAMSLQTVTGDTPASVDWTASTHFAAHFADQVLKRGLPSNAPVLNINIPRNATSATLVRRTAQSRQPYFVFKKPNRQNYQSGHKLPVDIVVSQDDLEHDSDIRAVIFDGNVSVTFLSWSMSSNADWHFPE